MGSIQIITKVIETTETISLILIKKPNAISDLLVISYFEVIFVKKNKYQFFQVWTVTIFVTALHDEKIQLLR